MTFSPGQEGTPEGRRSVRWYPNQRLSIDTRSRSNYSSAPESNGSNNYVKFYTGGRKHVSKDDIWFYIKKPSANGRYIDSKSTTFSAQKPQRDCRIVCPFKQWPQRQSKQQAPDPGAVLKDEVDRNISRFRDLIKHTEDTYHEEKMHTKSKPVHQGRLEPLLGKPNLSGPTIRQCIGIKPKTRSLGVLSLKTKSNAAVVKTPELRSTLSSTSVSRVESLPFLFTSTSNSTAHPNTAATQTKSANANYSSSFENVNACDSPSLPLKRIDADDSQSTPGKSSEASDTPSSEVVFTLPTSCNSKEQEEGTYRVVHFASCNFSSDENDNDDYDIFDGDDDNDDDLKVKQTFSVEIKRKSISQETGKVITEGEQVGPGSCS